ncbi:MAG: PhzF family phenazine biosynthesis protein [Cyanobacteria bacterium SBLK]|nr:PhzF family phenazine biosynthesis protein [Cyanobacteria bacterium SBLK]
MSAGIFYIVDVFAIDRYTGNPLAVFVNAGGTTALDMQALAQEMNYSETTFITGERQSDRGYPVRIFTPSKELPFAGHPTLGTAYILQKYVDRERRSPIYLNLKVGQIPVTVEKGKDGEEIFWMKQNAPTFQQELSPQSLAEVLSLLPEEIDGNFPIQEVSTGLPFIIVPLKKHQSLKQIQVRKEKYLVLIEKTEAKAILVFCPETNLPENQLSVRVFCEALGIPEDPATGSANGCLAGYLAKYDYFGDRPINICVEQGHEINRPSLLFLKATKIEKTIEIFVGGKVIEIAKGELI